MSRSFSDLLSSPALRSLHQQATAAVERRDGEVGRLPDEASLRIADCATLVAARGGYRRIDDVVFNQPTRDSAAGERFFVIQGDNRDPAHLRDSMLTRDALQMDMPQLRSSLEQAMEQRLSQQRSLDQQQERGAESVKLPDAQSRLRG